MRLLHIADLHLGQRFHDQDRGPEEQHALDQVLRIAREEAVDGVLLAGDIFDTANPGAAEMARYHSFLAGLVMEAGVAQVVVIAGNHDSAARIEGARELYAQCRIHAVGCLRREEPADKVLIPLHDRRGQVRAICLALPFLRDADVRMPHAGEDQASAAAAHRQAVAARCADLRAAAPEDLPLIVCAHAFVRGAAAAGDERPVQIGNLGQIPAADLAGAAAYLAMGHLHRPQTIAGRAHWRYAGSLLPTGFDEIATARQAVLVTVPVEGPVTVLERPLSAYRAYRAIAGDERHCLAELRNLPPAAAAEPRPWLRVQVRDQAVTGGLGHYLGDLAQARGWQLLHCQITIARAVSAADAEAPPPAEDVLGDPAAVFERLLVREALPAEECAVLRQAFAGLCERYEEILAAETT